MEFIFQRVLCGLSILDHIHIPCNICRTCGWIFVHIDLNTLERDDGWRGFRIQGVLDFSLIGILAKLSGILAEHQIGIFAVSTYNTDYILVKEENFERALNVLASEGYTIV